MYIAVLDSNIPAILISPAGPLRRERPLREFPHPQAGMHIMTYNMRLTQSI